MTGRPEAAGAPDASLTLQPSAVAAGTGSEASSDPAASPSPSAGTPGGERACIDCGAPAGRGPTGQRYRRCRPCAARRRRALQRVARRADYHRHRDRRRASSADWARRNRARSAARFRLTYWRNPEVRRAASRRYAADNRETERQRSRRWRRRRAAGEAGNYTDLEIFERDGWICQLCLGPVDPSLPRTDRLGATIDHIEPLSRGGTDGRDQVQLAHRSCNSSKRADG